MTKAIPRAFLLVLLVYVTLDLSLPAMPGAFVFDPAGSVESTYSRARQSTEAVLVSPPALDASRISRAEGIVGRPRLDAHASTRRSEHPLPRAAVGRVPADSTAEDPH